MLRRRLSCAAQRQRPWGTFQPSGTTAQPAKPRQEGSGQPTQLLLVGQAEEADLVQGVGSVGDQLAQENVL